MQIHPIDMPQNPLVTGLQHRENLKPLTPEEIRFEIDMCIGCDRCMSVCPVPMSSIVKIADLNRATVAPHISSQIAQFTTECVMCGSCVPVCPVDNHRDLLMLSLKQRLGVSWNGPVDMARLQQKLPPKVSPQFLLASLRDQPLFRDPQMIPDHYLLHLIDEAHVLTLAPQVIVIQEGTYGRDTYFILEGQFELSSTGPNGQQLTVSMLGRGEYLGDYAMLTGSQYSTTARTRGTALVLRVPEQVMQRLMEIVPPVQRYLEQLSYARSLEAMLKRMALFQGVADADLQWLTQHIQIRKYERDEQLFSEDSEDRPVRESLHILLAGFVKVSRLVSGYIEHESVVPQERVIAYRQRGDYFAGGLDMLGDRRAITATAITLTRVAEVPRATLLQLFLRYPEVAQRFNERLRQYSHAVDAAQTGLFTAVNPRAAHPSIPAAYAQEPSQHNVNPLSDPAARASLHALVSDGVVEGTEVLVIDLDTCIHCGECEAACERRHGHSRMNRKGIVVGNISIATACRHCQDPVCMLCSRAGISRMPSGEVYITENCIGCGICAERCPYDNISIVELADQHGKAVPDTAWVRLNTLFKKGFGKEYGRKTLPMASQDGTPNAKMLKPLEMPQATGGYANMLKKIAVKCDLCAGYDNQACIQACPTGAAFRVQPTDFFGSTEDILRRKPM
jgi:CRP-like cAMP-binding protein/Fe-S-cluster-containing hydrogenase component 2